MRGTPFLQEVRDKQGNRIAEQAAPILKKLAKKQEGVKISEEQAKRIPGYNCLLQLGYCVCKNGHIRFTQEYWDKIH